MKKYQTLLKPFRSNTSMLLLLLLFVLQSCKEDQKNNLKEQARQEVTRTEYPIPIGYSILAKVEGDLDADGVAERVVVYDTNKQTENGVERSIHLMKRMGKKWKLWYETIGIVLPSSHGGTLGDPFKEITIEDNTIIVRHEGKSEALWQYAHKYKLIEDTWKLIHAHIDTKEKCSNEESLSYDFIEGAISYKEYKLECKNGEQTDKSLLSEKILNNKMPDYPRMDRFYPGNNEIRLPKVKGTKFF